MADRITILHTPDCPNVALLRQRLTDALARIPGPAPRVVVEEVTDPDEAGRRDFHGSPALLIDGSDPFAGPTSKPAFACRAYRTEAGIEGAPSVDQIVAALAAADRWVQAGPGCRTARVRDGMLPVSRVRPLPP